MSRVYKKIVYELDQNVQYQIVFCDSYEYDGPVAECKKGRGQVDNASNQTAALGQQASNLATQNQGVQAGYRAEGDPFASSLLPSANGGLSPYAKAQLDQQKTNIAKTYADTAATGLKALAARGMGNAPTGATSSLLNTNNENQNQAETQAYQNAQQQTLGTGLQGLSYLQGQQQLYNPVQDISAATGAYGTSGNLGALRNKMGSTLGDVGAGLGTLGAAFGA